MSKQRKKNENGQLKKHFHDGQLDGFRLVTTLFFWLLMEKHDWKAEDIMVLHDEIMYEFDMLAKGFNTWKDVIDTVEEECNFTVVLKG